MSTLPEAPVACAGWVAAEFSSQECGLIGRWLEKRDGTQAPRFAAFAPEELRPWLPDLQIHELNGGRYLCRLSGVTASRDKGFDVSGRHLDEIVSPDVYASAKPMFDRARANGRPLRYRGRSHTEAGEWRCYRRLLLPVRRHEGACDTLISLLNFEQQAAPSRASSTILGSWELSEDDLREAFSPAA